MRTHTSGFIVSVVGLLGTATVANAAIFYSGVVNLAIPVTPTGLYINFQTGASGTDPNTVAGWDVNIGGSSSLYMSTPGGWNFTRLSSAAPTAGASNVGSGFNLQATYASGNASWITGGMADGLTLGSSDNYIGFKFMDASSYWHVGWMRLAIGASATGSDRKIVSYAYNMDWTTTQAGSSIVAGTTPAPGIAPLLFQAGILARSRRRR